MNRTVFDPQCKVWSGSELFPPSLGKTILEKLNEKPDMIGQISDDSGIHIKNRDISIHAIRVAQNLWRMGYQNNEIIGCLVKNTSEVASIVFGAFLIGTPINALDPRYSQDEIVHMFSLTKPQIVLCNNDNYETVVSVLKLLRNNAKIFIIGNKIANVGHVDDLLKKTGSENNFIPPKIDIDKQCAVILCSAGTVGLPKGVCISHATLLQNNQPLGILPQSVPFLYFSTLFGSSGISMLLQGTLSQMTRIITTKLFTPELAFKLIEKYKVAVISLPPIFIAQMLPRPGIKTTDMSSVKYVLSFGSPLPSAIRNEIRTYLPNGEIFTGYSMCEVGGLISFVLPGTMKNSVGQLRPGFKVKIINRQNELLDIGQMGEICIKSDYLFSGYYKDKEATKNAFDKDGWLLTGDLGYFDEDGDLFLVTRKKDIIKYCNHQVSPLEIEELIQTLDGVEMVCVVGVQDKARNDLPAAVIVKKFGSNLTEKDIHALIDKHLSDNKKLRGGVYFVGSLPMTPSGGIKKRIVRTIATEFYSGTNKG